MSSFLNQFHLHNAIAAGALPALENLAADGQRLERSRGRRFERDEPPPYVSSSESEDEAQVARYHPALARSSEAVLQENKYILDKPLTEREFNNTLTSLSHGDLYSPGKRYREEARHELDLLRAFCRKHHSSTGLRSILDHEPGDRRAAVIVRRNIRKRWERLGIWNPAWGIPGRVRPQPHDDVGSWKWKWQTSSDPPPKHSQHPITRALDLRRNLSCGEHAPPPPRSHLQEDCTASEAESFIISRPWFQWGVESVEFRFRKTRLPTGLLKPKGPDEDGIVTKWWKERGDWQASSTRLAPGWKWRHESPSPEPEDLTPLEDGNLGNMDFTPSEIDALEAITPPTPPARDPGHDSDHELDEPGAQTLHEAEAEQTANPSPTAPSRRRGRPRKTDQQPKDVRAAPPIPTRRSARIAAMNPLPAALSATTAKQQGVHAATSPSRFRHIPSQAPEKRRGRPPKFQTRGITKPSTHPAAPERKPKLPAIKAAKTPAKAATASAKEAAGTTNNRVSPTSQPSFPTTRTRAARAVPAAPPRQETPRKRSRLKTTVAQKAGVTKSAAQRVSARVGAATAAAVSVLEGGAGDGETGQANRGRGRPRKR
ncbi:hypothetical protein BT67DRAFT_89442 [Trichocladium antarcticum]|uniref:Uncharacterized protein n=1 Tax=Trichocladium antarcticum TaxID=1450529 RepID=A0AAN6UG70_9PEZI|nr:hypothetical protein BT67DRAFT_89442 [Trichocladium antarcticum]